MKKINNITRMAAFLALVLALASCGRDRNDPGIQYAPEMYESIPYEPFKQVADSTTPFPDGHTMQLPPEGTIQRGGHAAFEFPEGDSVRKSPGVINMVNPVPKTDVTLAEGEVLYTRFCAVCHGGNGKGDGPVAKHDAITPTAYDNDRLKNYTDGQIYHTIMYGQGVMGSYATQLDYEERWKVVHFVKTLQGNGEASADDTAPAEEGSEDGTEAPAEDGATDEGMEDGGTDGATEEVPAEESQDDASHE